MAAVHDVLRYLLERVPHSTQDDHDHIAHLIDSDEHTKGSDDASTPEPADVQGGPTP